MGDGDGVATLQRDKVHFTSKFGNKPGHYETIQDKLTKRFYCRIALCRMYKKEIET